MRKNMMQGILGASMVALLAFCLTAEADRTYHTWNNAGDTNDWNESANWDPPGDNPSPSYAFDNLEVDVTINMSGDDRAVLSSPCSPSWNGRIEGFHLGVGSGNTGELDMTGDAFLSVHRGDRKFEIGYDGGTGILNMEGGNIYVEHGTWDIGVGEGSVGILNQSGGRTGYSYFSPAGTPHIGTDGGTGEYNISGGQAHFLTGATVGSGGTLRVIGSGADEIFFGHHGWTDVIGSSELLVEGGGTLDFQIDETAEGITPIELLEEDDSVGDVVFESGARLDLGWAGDPVYGTWTVMTWTGDLTGGDNLALADGVDDSIWSFDIQEGGSGSLMVTAIPEPSSLLLLGVAGLLLMKRRRV